MADYPNDLPQVLGTKVVPDAGTVIDRAVSGKPRFRTYYTSERFEITLVHELDALGRSILLVHYINDKYNAFNVKIDQDNTSWEARYVNRPLVVPIAGNRWKATVRLVTT